MLTSTHASFVEYGIPLGLIDHRLSSVYIAQDAFTRQHHPVTSKEFVRLGTGDWRHDSVLSMAYTGSIAMIDPASQTITHIYDDSLTVDEECENLDVLIVDHLMRMASGGLAPPT